MGKTKARREQRDESVRTCLDGIKRVRATVGTEDLSLFEVTRILYLGSNGYTSNVEISGEIGVDITRGLVGRKMSDINRDLGWLPGVATRVVRDLEDRGYIFQLTRYNCERVADGRVREEILSKKGTRSYNHLVDMLFED